MKERGAYHACKHGLYSKMTYLQTILVHNQLIIVTALAISMLLVLTRDFEITMIITVVRSLVLAKIF